jgi:class 3 adenylate cyclase
MLMSQNNNNFPREKSNRIVLFADLRDSTDILLSYEKNIYKKRDRQSQSAFAYGEFILALHETSYRELYLGHENTYAEIYGDGVMGVFPEDNTKYILENIYRLSNKMRLYNDSPGVGVSRPKIDIGFGVTVGEVTFVYYPLDERNHPVGHCIHEAARIEGVSKLYDARILVSHRFFNFAKSVINSDPRFSYRFIDRVILKNFREPLTLYEILVDNDPRFEVKRNSIRTFSEAYFRYCKKQWKEAKEIFSRIDQEYRLGIGSAMAERCDILAVSPPGPDWEGIWRLKDK